MCECLDYDDGTRHTCEACVGDLETMREMLAAAERRAEEAEAKYAHIADGYIAAQKLLDDERERVEKWIAYTEQLKEEKGLLHESLNGCAEKLASERAARESWEREFSVANTERLRLHDEVENLVERIGQFEAAGFPSVSVVLDRVETERAARVAAERERDEALAEQNASKRRLAAMVDLAEKRGAAYDIANERIADLQRTVRTVFALIADWRDGNARLGRPRSFVDQRFLDALVGVKTDEITEVKLIVQGQRGGTATFTHWSGTATKSEEP